MEKLMKLFVCLLLTGLFSCSRGNGPAPADSVKADHATVDTVPVAAGINNLEALLPQLPLLKFPVTFNVEDYKKEKAFPVSFNQQSPWFTNSLDYSKGKKVSAIGKFYLDFNTVAVVFLISAPSAMPERPDDEALILSLFNIETGAVNSRVVAIGEAEVHGNTRMKTPNKGKSFVHEENAEINLTFVEFAIKNGKFVEGNPEHKTFPGDQKGSDAAETFIKKRMK
jgi:hypothetical protein